MQKHSYYLAKYFAKKKIHVDLYHYNESNYDISLLEYFTTEEKKYINSIVVQFPKKIKFPGHYIIESFNYSEAIYSEFIKQEPADFVYIKGFSGWKLLDEKRKGIEFPPIGVNFHGYEMFQKQADFLSELKARFILQQPVKFQIKHADFIFSYGGKITELLNNLGIVSKRIIEIPTAIEADWLSDKEKVNGNKVKFVYVGRYERRKGIEELNVVLKKMIVENLNFEFHFIGPIPANKKLHDSKIIYHGKITNTEELKKLLDEMQVLVCPSYAEGMPNVILEAMARKLAIITTNVGANSLLVNDSNGKLIEELSIHQLEKTIEDFTKMQPDFLIRMQRNSHKKLKENFLWEEVIEKTVRLIESKI